MSLRDYVPVGGEGASNRLLTGNVKLAWPSYSDMAVTVFRPYPAVENQQFLAYRKSAQPNDFTDWITAVPAMAKWGKNSLTFALQPIDRPNMDPRQTPPAVIYPAMRQALRTGRDPGGWQAMVEGGQGRSPIISAPTDLYLVQGFMLQRGPQYKQENMGGVMPQDPTWVIPLKGQVGSSLLTLCNQLRDGVPPTTDNRNFDEVMAYGDITRLDAGKFVVLYRLPDGDPRARMQVSQASVLTAGGQRQGGGTVVQGYGVYLEDNWANIPARFDQYAQYVMQKVQPWQNLLMHHTLDELVQICIDEVDPSVLFYAWQDHPEWCTEELVRRASAAHSVPVGGTVPGQSGVLPPPPTSPGAPGFMPAVAPQGYPPGYPGAAVAGLPPASPTTPYAAPPAAQPAAQPYYPPPAQPGPAPPQGWPAGGMVPAQPGPAAPAPPPVQFVPPPAAYAPATLPPMPAAAPAPVAPQPTVDPAMAQMPSAWPAAATSPGLPAQPPAGFTVPATPVSAMPAPVAAPGPVPVQVAGPPAAVAAQDALALAQQTLARAQAARG